jgi:hypothetical protein
MKSNTTSNALFPLSAVIVTALLVLVVAGCTSRPETANTPAAAQGTPGATTAATNAGSGAGSPARDQDRRREFEEAHRGAASRRP